MPISCALAQDMGTTSAVFQFHLISGSITVERSRPKSLNKIFILGRKITMSEIHVAIERVVVKRWAVLYCHSTSNSKFSRREIFLDYKHAIMCFNRGCNYIDTDYDGYNYVALLWYCVDSVGFRPVAFRDNLGCAWDMEDTVDG